MVNVALIGPLYNGLDKYLTPLASALTSQGCDVDRIGLEDINFDLEKIKIHVRNLVQKTNWHKYDILHYNYGTYDAEQLIPLLIPDCPASKILTIHSIQLDLFRKVGDLQLAKVVNQKSRMMDGYCFFTKYARQVTDLVSSPNIVSWHPPNHESINVSLTSKQRLLKSWGLNESSLIVTILGYPSHWKDATSVLKAAKQVPEIQFIFGGLWWDQKLMREGYNRETMPNIKSIAYELNEIEIVTLIESGIGLLPYREYPSFQGSGLLPNYLARGVTCIVSNIPPLMEYVNNRHFVVDINDETALVTTIKQALNIPHQSPDPNFSYSQHTKEIVKFYSQLLNSEVKRENTSLS